MTSASDATSCVHDGDNPKNALVEHGVGSVADGRGRKRSHPSGVVGSDARGSASVDSRCSVGASATRRGGANQPPIAG